MKAPPNEQPNYIEHNSIYNCITAYIDSGSAKQNFFVRNITYNSSRPSVITQESSYDNIVITNN